MTNIMGMIMPTRADGNKASRCKILRSTIILLVISILVVLVYPPVIRPMDALYALGDDIPDLWEVGYPLRRPTPQEELDTMSWDELIMLAFLQYAILPGFVGGMFWLAGWFVWRITWGPDLS